MKKATNFFEGVTGNMRNQWLRALVGFVWGLLLFLGFAWSLRLGLGPTTSGSALLSQLVLKTALVLVALIGWKLLGRSFSEMGWRRADWWNRSYGVWFAIAALSMMAGSVVAILLGVRHPVASQMSFLQMVLVVWLLSSFSEEVYVRGLVQSWVADRDDGKGINSAFGTRDRVVDSFVRRDARALDVVANGCQRGSNDRSFDARSGLCLCDLEGSNQKPLAGYRLSCPRQRGGGSRSNPRRDPLSSGSWSPAGIPVRGLRGTGASTSMLRRWRATPATAVSSRPGNSLVRFLLVVRTTACGRRFAGPYAVARGPRDETPGDD